MTDWMKMSLKQREASEEESRKQFLKNRRILLGTIRKEYEKVRRSSIDRGKTPFSPRKLEKK